MFEQIIVVRTKTYLEKLIHKFNTKNQAEFYLKSSGRDFKGILNEHETFYDSFKILRPLLDKADRHKIIDKSFLPNFMFSKKDLIVGIGQDGLIANIAKYAKGQPIIGLNPNPQIYDGILLPYDKISSKKMTRFLQGDFDVKNVTMAKAEFNDGQSLLAFNDFFVGPKSHTSARYKINFNNISENQSSSGIIVSTNIGSTGWLSSISNMVTSISGNSIPTEMRPKKNNLFFIVREPFLSKTSEVSLTHGIIDNQKSLVIESKMVNTGVLFSDGIVNDCIPFNIGKSVKISIAKEKATLVQ